MTGIGELTGSQVWWLKPIIPPYERLRQEDPLLTVGQPGPGSKSLSQKGRRKSAKDREEAPSAQIMRPPWERLGFPEGIGPLCGCWCLSSTLSVPRKRADIRWPWL